MALVDKPYDHGVHKRLLDYYSRSTPWNRQLWRLSSVLEIRELLEANRARHEGVLSESSVKYLSDGLIRRIRRDVGFGSEKQRGIIVGAISRKLEPESHDAYVLGLLADQADESYLQNWADAVRAGQPSPEVVSRAVGGSLLDAGFSAEFLHKWWTFHGRHAPGSTGIGDVIEEAVRLARRPAVRYTVLVPLVSSPPLPSPAVKGVEASDNWLDATSVSDWLAQWVPEVKPLRQAGGLIVDIEARDVPAAVNKAATMVARLEARFRVGARRQLKFLDELFIIGEDVALPYALPPRRVEVHALQKTSAVFDLDLSAEVSSALELLEPLDLGTPAAAVAGSWAAIEALFVGPGDGRNRVTAATRMARIVACSYVRAELTTLANAYSVECDDALAGEIRRLQENIDRARTFEDALKTGRISTFSRTRHRLALHRMQSLIAEPADILPKIVCQLEDSFRRLYRQKNLILHAGDLTSIALAGTLRTTAPLVGAGIDRIVHASAVGAASPLQVAATAEVNLERVVEGDTRLVELLG
ncbi:hypothetical protein AB0J83_32060 [Actinoplanes sp. NPDC049596]|uniref:hypothetical protein n=1 Tax=unclassified Actinoplanes TaxID=2626549 RepID=UPI00343DD767